MRSNSLRRKSSAARRSRLRRQSLNIESLEPRYVLTDVAGTLTSDTVWDLAGSPFNVTDTVTVLPAATLEIEPGVVVQFQNNTGLDIRGRIVAEGSAFHRITFEPAAGVEQWEGLSIRDTLADSRISYADMIAGDDQGEAINVNHARLTLDNIVWTGTVGTILELEHPSIIIRNSHFPRSNGGEIVHGEYIEGDEYLIIEGNVFENSDNGGDVIDILGADRPGPVMQILNNVFKGGGDDGLDLDGTDAHVEGNLFMGFHENTTRSTTSNAIATGLPQSGEDNRTQVTIVRNIFFDNDHAILLKEDAFATVTNNVFVGMTEAAIQFNEIGGTAVNGPGMGAELDGNIFWNNALLFQNLVDDVDFQSVLTVDRSILPNDVVDFDGTPINAHDLGVGNIDADPMFVDLVGGNFRLQPGSPGIDAGPNGLDMGAYVLAGPSITGVPTTTSTGDGLVFTIAGPGITHYRYRLNDEPYGPATSVDIPITLDSLASGDYHLDVLGMNSAGEWFAGQLPAYRENRGEIIAPTTARTGDMLPIVVRVRDSHGQINSLLTTPAQFVNTSDLDSVDFRLKKGVGSFSPTVTAGADFDLQFGGDLADSPARSIHVLDNSFPVQTYSGVLAGDTTWDDTAERQVTGDLVVPAGVTLTISAGTRIVLGDTVNMDVEGAIVVAGTQSDPVVFNSLDPAQPWGGITLGDAAEGTFDYSFFTNAGGDSDREFGHSDSQPVLLVDGGELNLTNSFIIDTVGKGLGSRDARLNIDQVVISNTDTGGEFQSSVVKVTNTYVKDIPNDDLTFNDDDNDGFYFNGLHSSEEPSLFQDSFVLTTLDDGLDQNGAQLNVVRAWIEGVAHEGVAGSNSNGVNIVDSVFMRNNQGVEAGYREPLIEVSNSVLFNNDGRLDPDSQITAGLRFGDGYDGSNGPYEGHITAVNNVIHDNGNNVRNYDGTIPGPQEGAIDITYSMTNDEFYDNDLGNFSGLPLFGPYMHLLRGSSGLGAGDDGEAVGRVFPALQSTFTVTRTDGLLRINEVLADNVTVDRGGAFSDMVELYNGGDTVVDLVGYSLSNDPADPQKFEFPAGTSIAPGEHLTLVADDGGGDADLHLGFELAGSGDQLALYEGGTVVDAVTFGSQLADHSISRLADGRWQLSTPTFDSTNEPLATAQTSALLLNEWLAAGTADFIELFNTSSLPIDMGGVGITNDIDAPDKFAIRPLSFVGGDSLPVFTATDLGFDLDESGGSLALFDLNGNQLDRVDYGAQALGISAGRRPNGGAVIGFLEPPSPGEDNLAPVAEVVEPLVLIDANWAYEQNGLDLGTAWREPDFNDTAWPRGDALLYVEDSDTAGPKNTPLDLNADGAGENTITFYFRHTFEFIGDLNDTFLRLTTLIDDGAVVYLNGEEIHRFNMDQGDVLFDTLAASTEEADVLANPVTISSSNLLVGTNVLAVEVHQRDVDSSDIVFGLMLDAVASTDTTPPSLPSNLTAATTSVGQVTLDWAAAVDPQTGIDFYNVYRGGTLIGTTVNTSYVDSTVEGGLTYSYEVSAVNTAGMEGDPAATIVTVALLAAFQDGAYPDAAYAGTDDTWIRGGGASDEVRGDDIRMDADASSSGTVEWSLIRWDLTSIPDSQSIDSATVTLTLNNASDDIYDLFALTRPWVESEATFNEYAAGQAWEEPGTGASDRGVLLGRLISNDVTGTHDVILNTAGVDTVSGWIQDPSTNFGLIIYGPASDDGIEIRTSEYATVAERPRLTLRLFDLPGDVNKDGHVDADDINVMCSSVEFGSTNPLYDLDGNSVVDQADIDHLVLNLLGTHYGDADLDGQVDATDLAVWIQNQFQNGRWSEGDFNCTGDVDVRDFNIWNDHRFSAAPAAAHAERTPRAPLSHSVTPILHTPFVVKPTVLASREKAIPDSNADDEVTDRVSVVKPRRFVSDAQQRRGGARQSNSSSVVSRPFEAIVDGVFANLEDFRIWNSGQRHKAPV